ncbi:MAG: hypothetical protein ACRDH2_07060 [Anaerolineales bacterium]
MSGDDESRDARKPNPPRCRHQPAHGGFVFRVGANWTYAYGFPYQVSFGHAF